MYLELVNITGCSRFGQVPLSNLLICRIPLWPSHQRLSPSLMSLLMTADSSTIYIPDVSSSRQHPSLSNMLVLLGNGKTAAFFWICHPPLLSFEWTHNKEHNRTLTEATGGKRARAYFNILLEKCSTGRWGGADQVHMQLIKAYDGLESSTVSLRYTCTVHIMGHETSSRWINLPTFQAVPKNLFCQFIMHKYFCTFWLNTVK